LKARYRYRAMIGLCPYRFLAALASISRLIVVFLRANFVSHRKRCHRSQNLLPARLPLSPVVAPLLSRPRLPAPLLLRSPGVLLPRIAGVGGWRTPVARRAGCFTNRAGFSIVLGVTRFLVRRQAILGIDDLAFPIHSEAFGERFSAPALRFAGLEIDGFARELAFGLRRRRCERDFRCGIGPYRLDHRLEDRYCNVAAGRAAAQRAALAVGVVVADPDRDSDVVGEPHEPGIVLLVGGAGLPRDIR